MLESLLLVLLKAYSTAGEAEAQQHKPLWPPDARDLVGISLAALGLIVASGGELGGGGILIPLYIIVFGFHVKHALALTSITLLGGALANVFMAVNQRHRHVDRPLIDWSLVILMEPLAILGAVAGTYLFCVLPPLILTLLLVMIFSFLAYGLTKRGVKRVRREGGWRVVLGLQQEKKPVPITVQRTYSSMYRAAWGYDSEKKSLLNDYGHTQKPLYGDGSRPSTPQTVDAVRKLVAAERHVAVWKPLFISGVLAGVMVLTSAKHFVRCGSAGYWVIAASPVLWVLPCFFYARHRVLDDWELKESIAYKFTRGDVRWTPWNTVVLPVVAAAGGLLAGTFGLGGGSVKGPLMLDMGVLPSVCRATVSVMILFTTAAAASSFLSMREVPIGYGLTLFCLGVACPFIGTSIFSRLSALKKRHSPVLLSTALMMVLSTIGMTYQDISQLIADPAQVSSLGSVCRHSIVWG